MKLALIRQRYTAYGGAERFIERALQPLQEAGVEVALLARHWDRQNAAGGFRFLQIDPAYAWWRGRSGRDASFAAAVGEALRNESFDLVQSHERLAGCHIFRAGDGVHAAWLDYCGQADGPIHDWMRRHSPFHRGVLERERAMLDHPALRRVICNSRLVADEFRRYYGMRDDQLRVIPNGIDLEAFHPQCGAQHAKAVRQELAVPQDAPLLVFVGNGFARKGVFRLMEAMQGLDDPPYLVVVGGDRQMSRARQLAGQGKLAGKIRLLGPQKEVRPFLAAADAFVLPTLYDPFPNAALEALACGLPILTTETCGARECVTEGVNGFIVRALDGPALAQGLGRLCELSREPVSHERARASVAHLSIDRLVRELTALYQELLAGAPATI